MQPTARHAADEAAHESRLEQRVSETRRTRAGRQLMQPTDRHAAVEAAHEARLE